MLTEPEHSGPIQEHGSFNVTEDKLILATPSLPITITLDILELTSTSLKVKGSIPDLQNLTGPPIEIQMTFAPK